MLIIMSIEIGIKIFEEYGSCTNFRIDPEQQLLSHELWEVGYFK